MAEPGRPRGYRLLHTNSVEVLLRLSRHLRPALIPVLSSSSWFHKAISRESDPSSRSWALRRFAEGTLASKLSVEIEWQCHILMHQSWAH